MLDCRCNHAAMHAGAADPQTNKFTHLGLKAVNEHWSPQASPDYSVFNSKYLPLRGYKPTSGEQALICLKDVRFVNCDLAQTGINHLCFYTVIHTLLFSIQIVP